MNQEMWLSSNDQSECLQRRGYVNLRIDNAAAATLDLAKVVDVAIRRDSPQNICRVDATEFVRARQVVDIQFNPRAPPALTSHLCRALQTRKPDRSVERDLDCLIQRIGDRNRCAARVILSRRRDSGNQHNQAREGH